MLMACIRSLRNRLRRVTTRDFSWDVTSILGEFQKKYYFPVVALIPYNVHLIFALNQQNVDLRKWIDSRLLTPTFNYHGKYALHKQINYQLLYRTICNSGNEET